MPFPVGATGKGFYCVARAEEKARVWSGRRGYFREQLLL